jgi:hypothetical protein
VVTQQVFGEARMPDGAQSWPQRATSCARVDRSQAQEALRRPVRARSTPLGFDHQHMTGRAPCAAQPRTASQQSAMLSRREKWRGERGLGRDR